MLEIDVSRLIHDVDPSELSGSIAERGNNDGHLVTRQYFDYTKRDAVREFRKEFQTFD